MIQKRMIIFINSRGVITWQKSQQKGTKLITLFSRFVKMSNMFTSHPVFTLRSHRIRHLHQHVVLLSLLGLYDSYCARSEMNRKVKKKKKNYRQYSFLYSLTISTHFEDFLSNIYLNAFQLQLFQLSFSFFSSFHYCAI